MVPGAKNDKIMKTIAEIVADNKERILCAGTSAELRQIGIELGFDNRSAFPRYKAALLKVCGIDYAAVREARREQNELAAQAAIETAVAGQPLHLVYCDAARRSNAVGAKAAVIVLDEAGTEVARCTAVNGNCHTANGDYDQFAAECFGVLKAVETAKEMKLSRIEVRNDRIGSFEASTKFGYDGAKYLWLAKKIAAENSMLVTFNQIAGEDNIADGLSRSSEICRLPAEQEAFEIGQRLAAEQRIARDAARVAAVATDAPVATVGEAKNPYGNVDIIHGVRAGLRHFNYSEVSKLAKSLGGKTEKKAHGWMTKNGIEFAEALTGFSGRVPQFSGVVVLERDAAKVEAQIAKFVPAPAPVCVKTFSATAAVSNSFPTHDDLDERGIAARDIINGNSLTILNFKGTRRRTISLAAFLALPGSKIERRNAGWNLDSF
jgi:hypothetical protein